MMKTAARAIGWGLALPYRCCYALGKAALGEQRAITGASERIAKVPGLLGVYCRQAFYSRVLDGVGQDVYFGFMSLFSKPGARLGDRVYIGRFCTVGLADIGDDVMLADGVQILSGRHQHGSPGDSGESGGTMRDQPQQFDKVTIGAGAWIGAGAIVMADVGAGAVVAAGAVVVKPVEAGARVGGVPARGLG